ncbi:hypothetical protein QS257_20785 [Terrilactibacillus sp. S3-3]|nr:hypothetical protein QS257_20785 [Terrilactibacillus sp. S3-3]
MIVSMTILGVLLIALTLLVMISIFIKANNNIKRTRRKEDLSGGLNNFGYKQELLRDMGGFSNFAVSFFPDFNFNRRDHALWIWF